MDMDHGQGLDAGDASFESFGPVFGKCLVLVDLSCASLKVVPMRERGAAERDWHGRANAESHYMYV